MSLDEDLFQAFDIIVSKKLEDLYFDKTLICTITDDTDRRNGQYIVSDGSVSFAVYGENSYTKGEQVRVSVPNGDMSQTKFIAGKYIPVDSITPVYISSLENIIDMTGNLLNTSDIYGIPANSNAINEILVSTIDLTNSDYQDVIQNSIYDVLYVVADFKTIFKNKIVNGNYGIKIGLFLNKNSTVPDKYFYLDSSLMLGNPYQFSTYFKQVWKFDISYLENISKLQISLYQKNNFKYYNVEGKSVLLEQPSNEIQNIFVKDINIGFGLSVDRISDNTVKLYTSGDLIYNNKDEVGSNNRKISLLWINKDETNTFLGFSDGIYDPSYDEIRDKEEEKSFRYSIYWYRYCPTHYSQNSDDSDKFAKSGWVRIPTKENLGLPSASQLGLNNELYYAKKSTKDEDFLNVTLDLGAKEEQFMAVVVYDHTAYYSAPLVFTNILGYKNISIEHGDNSIDKYLTYGTDGKLIDSGEGNIQRYLKVSFDNMNNLKGSTIYWFVPKEKTMIKPFPDNSFSVVDKTDSMYQENYYGYFKIIDTEADYQFRYQISDYYLNTYTHNDIQCFVKNTNYQHLKATKSLNFGIYDAEIREYTIQIEAVNNQKAIKVNQPLELAISIVDKYGEKLDLKEKEKEYFLIDENDITGISSFEFESVSPYRIEYLGIVDENNTKQIKCKLTYNQEEFSVDELIPHAILKVSAYMYGHENPIMGYYIVPFSAGDYFIKGATSIIYNNYGKNPQYYKGAYELYDANTGLQITEDVFWRIKYSDPAGREITESADGFDIHSSYIPTLKEGDNSLSICKDYLQGENTYTSIYCQNNIGKIYWIQPLFITLKKNLYSVNNEGKSLSTSLGNQIEVQSGQMSYDASNSKVSGVVVGSKTSPEEETESDEGVFGLYVYSEDDEVIKINPKEVKIIGKKVVDDTVKQIIIDSTAEEFPFQIVHQTDGKDPEVKYSLNWDGVASSTTLSVDSISADSLKIGEVEVIKIDDKGKINISIDGSLTAKGITNNGTLTTSGITNNGTLTNNGNISMDRNTIEAYSGKFTTLTKGGVNVATVSS